MVEFNEDVHISGNSPEDVSGLPVRATRRLRIDSYERSNRPNGRAGDAIALHWMRPEAKAFIGWWDTTDPENPECKAWIGAHDKANNPAAAPHRHFSIEVTDSRGHMQTRLGIPYDEDHTNISVNKADLTVNRGAFRIPARSSLEFSVDAKGTQNSRWAFKMTPDENLEVVHYADVDAQPKPIARMDAATGRLEIDSLGATDIVLKDRATGRPTRVFVENGSIHIEEV